MRALITGAHGTPYAHGCYIFDIFLDNNYPNQPPKVNLITTGGEQIRFNPNLYINGYVCLSLLGTWSGAGCERWTVTSSILQVLVSIQSLVMSENVYGNEPGFEKSVQTPEGKKLNEGYSNIVKYGNIQYAMIEMLRNPPNGYKEVVEMHFFLKKRIILEDVKRWVAEAKKSEALYTGLVGSHNPKLAVRLVGDFHRELMGVVGVLEKELERLKLEIKREFLYNALECQCEDKERCGCGRREEVRVEEEKVNA